jgi:hypothetical protein
MNLLFKLIWVLCLTVALLSISAALSRFYQTGRLFMLCAGFVALLFLASMLCNAVFVLFFKGA